MKVLAAISFCDIYTDRSQMDPEYFQRAHRCISDKQFSHFVSSDSAVHATLYYVCFHLTRTTKNMNPLS